MSIDIYFDTGCWSRPSVKVTMPVSFEGWRMREEGWNKKERLRFRLRLSKAQNQEQRPCIPARLIATLISIWVSFHPFSFILCHAVALAITETGLVTVTDLRSPAPSATRYVVCGMRYAVCSHSGIYPLSSTFYPLTSVFWPLKWARLSPSAQCPHSHTAIYLKANILIKLLTFNLNVVNFYSNISIYQHRNIHKWI